MTEPGVCSAEDVLLAIADAVSRPPVSTRAARSRLAVLARRLPAPTGEAAADLTAVAALLRDHLPSHGRGLPLLLPDALRAGSAHTLAAAAAGVAAARRAGMAIDVVGNGDRVWLAHEGGACALVVDPGAPKAPFDGRLLGIDLHWRCAHELAALTLARLAHRAERSGDLDLALRVVRARMELPLDHGEARDAQARMN
jgi:hypothetical protein